MDKVRERGPPLPGNDRENWGNHHIDVTEIWRGRGKEEGWRKQRECFKEKERKRRRKGKRNLFQPSFPNNSLAFPLPQFLFFLLFSPFSFSFHFLLKYSFSAFSYSSFFSYSSSYFSYINVMISSIFPAISWESSGAPHSRTLSIPVESSVFHTL